MSLIVKFPGIQYYNSKENFPKWNIFQFIQKYTAVYINVFHCTYINEVQCNFVIVKSLGLAETFQDIGSSK